MNITTGLLGATAVAALGLASGLALAEGGEPVFRFSTGAEYATGTYGGSEDIEEFYVPFTTRMDYGRFGFRLTLPYVRVDEGDDGPTESGIGDVITSVTLYDLIVSDAYDFVVDATGKVKFGTADETKGLGTGENDYTFQLDAYKYFDRFSLQGTAGYRWRGEPPEVPLDDVFLGSLGGFYDATQDTSLGLFYDYRQSAVSGMDDIRELSGSVSHRFNAQWRFQVYAFAGFGDFSPDWGAGFLVTTDLRLLRGSDRS